MTDKSTSIWATEASCDLPQSALIDGFDVSAAQYPHRNWLPKNVHLHVHDAFAPFPPDRIGMYDIVNLRFFFTLLDPKNVQDMVENLMMLLSAFPGNLITIPCPGKLGANLLASCQTVDVCGTKREITTSEKRIRMLPILIFHICSRIKSCDRHTIWHNPTM